MIYNLGSINVDHIYGVPHMPAPGETLAASRYTTSLGGKGANQSVAAARARAQVCHIGAVGRDGDWAIRQMTEFGVDTTHIAALDTPTGHAIITVDPSGENAIVIYPGANVAQDMDRIRTALSGATPGDWLMLQNETSHQVETATMAQAAGLQVAYSAAPFAPEAVRAILPHTDLLIMNAVEAQQLSDSLTTPLTDLPVHHVIVTKGKNGADWMDTQTKEVLHIPAHAVTPVDTTGAGDTFAGYAVAGLDAGLTPQAALHRASAAAALSTTRHGTAQAIPDADEVTRFMR